MRVAMGKPGTWAQVAVSILLVAGCRESLRDPELLDAPGARPQGRSVPGDASRRERNPLRNAYFGDLHLHTRNSLDAYTFGVRATPDDAYRYAKGEAIRHPLGYPIRLRSGPLDFLAGWTIQDSESAAAQSSVPPPTFSTVMICCGGAGNPSVFVEK